MEVDSFLRGDGQLIKVNDEIFFNDERKGLTRGTVLQFQVLPGASAEGEDLCMVEVDLGGRWGGPNYSVLKQAAEVLTSADLASKTHLPRAPRAAAAKAGAAIAAIGSGQTLVISQPGEDNSSGRVYEVATGSSPSRGKAARKSPTPLSTPPDLTSSGGQPGGPPLRPGKQKRTRKKTKKKQRRLGFGTSSLAGKQPLRGGSSSGMMMMGLGEDDDEEDSGEDGCSSVVSVSSSSSYEPMPSASSSSSPFGRRQEQQRDVVQLEHGDDDDSDVPQEEELQDGDETETDEEGGHQPLDAGLVSNRSQHHRSLPSASSASSSGSVVSKTSHASSSSTGKRKRQASGFGRDGDAWRNASKEELVQRLSGMLADSAERRDPARPVSEWCLTYEEYEVALEAAFKELGGVEAIEQISRIKGQKVAHNGTKTMYGAIREPLIRRIAEVAGVTAQDKFVDVGAGLNQVSLQLALTTGCKAVGMEVIDERHAVGVAVANAVKEVLVETGLVPRPAAEAMAERTTNIHGDIRQHYHQIETSSVIYMNNVGDWLHDPNKRDAQRLTIHQAVCLMFARSPVGTRLIVLERIPDFHASWVQLTTLTAPPSWFSWRMGNKEIFVYRKVSDTWRCQFCDVDNDILDAFAPQLHCPVCTSRAKTATRSNSNTTSLP